MYWMTDRWKTEKLLVKFFLTLFVTGDEKWINFQNPKKKQWVNLKQPKTWTAKPERFGLLHQELLRPGEIVYTDC